MVLIRFGVEVGWGAGLSHFGSPSAFGRNVPTDEFFPICDRRLDVDKSSLELDEQDKKVHAAAAETLARWRTNSSPAVGVVITNRKR